MEDFVCDPEIIVLSLDKASSAEQVHSLSFCNAYLGFLREPKVDVESN